jgi:hypothetical protein
MPRKPVPQATSITSQARGQWPFFLPRGRRAAAFPLLVGTLTAVPSQAAANSPRIEN